MYRESKQEAVRQIISSLQDLAGSTVDMGLGLLKTIEGINRGDVDLTTLYEEIRDLDSKIYLMQKSLINELFRFKHFLGEHLQIFYNLIVLIGDVVDEMDGAAFRLANLNAKKLPKRSIEWVRKIINSLNRELEAFREALYFLAYNPSSVPASVERILEVEEEIDNLHRKALSEVFENLDAKELLIWMQVVDRLEASADLLRKIGDVLLTLYMM